MKGYLGEIRWVNGKMIPKNWLHCNGQEMKIEIYPALFDLIGNEHGGDGQASFSIPDLTDSEKLQGGLFVICVKGPLPLQYAC